MPCLAILVLVAAACRHPVTPDPSAERPAYAPIRGRYVGPGTYEVAPTPGTTPYDVLFVFTNTGTSTASATVAAVDPSVSAAGPRVLQPIATGAETPPPVPAIASPSGAAPANLDKAAAVAALNRALPEPLPAVPRSLLPAIPRQVTDSVGQTALFTVLADFSTAATAAVAATCRLVRQAAYGQAVRSLSIWVEDDSWVVGGTTPNRVTQAMVDALADAYLVDGGQSVYWWVRDVAGEEWSGTGSPSLIPYDGSVTILLHDIERDRSTNGGYLGLFWGKDNYERSSYAISNERVMFYLDSVLLATRDGATWDLDDYWPAEALSTLAHEQQHMVHFHEKRILRGVDDHDWLDELCSMAVEDLAAERMGVPGPRGSLDPDAGIPGQNAGRLPLYNAYPWTAVGVWDGGLEDYATEYSFGAFLTRNYGGAAFVYAILHSDAADAAAVEEAAATHVPWAPGWVDLVADWGASVLLSDRTDAPAGYRYNTGSWMVDASADGTEYRLGSINLFNYRAYDENDDPVGDGPRFAAPGTLPPGANVFWRAAVDASGDRAWSVVLPDDVTLTVIVK